MFLWNSVGERQGCKLGVKPEIREWLRKIKSIRALCRVLTLHWLTNSQDIFGNILKFIVSPLLDFVYENSRRPNLMKIIKSLMSLDIRTGDKLTCIKNILILLLNPYANPRWKPAVLLEQIKIEDIFFIIYSSWNNVKLRADKCFSSSRKPKEKDFKSNLSTTRSKRCFSPVNQSIYSVASHYGRNVQEMSLNNKEII